jgi:uncharacterized SAM-binding protein YcdF (DUF218 family)
MNRTLLLLNLTRIFKGLLLGAGWLAILPMLAGLAGLRPEWRAWRRRLGILTIVFALLCTLPPLPELLEWSLVQWTAEVPPASAGAIVGFGEGISLEGLPTTTSGAVAQQTARLWHAGLAPLIVLSTGRTVEVSRSEAEGMALIVTALGVPTTAVIRENQSVNTYENAVETARILRQHRIGRVLLVCSRLHLLRCTLALRRQGIKVLPVAAEQREHQYDLLPIPSWNRAEKLQQILNEYFGLLSYWLQQRL